jgi:acyl carrier protein
VTKTEFYETIDEILEVSPGTIKGDEHLKDLESWDSLAVVSFIAMMHAALHNTIPAAKVKASRSVQDLFALVSDKITD